MDISGKLVQILQEQSGEGKNGKWAKCDFIIETQEKFPKKVCLTAWNDLIQTVRNMPEGTDMKVSFDISSREYNGRWYTDVKAWKVEAGSGSSAPARSNERSTGSTNSSPVSIEPSSERYVSEDDLPF